MTPSPVFQSNIAPISGWFSLSQSNNSVVPISVDAGPLYHHWLKRSGTITYRIHDPLPPGLPRGEVEERVHAAINAQNPV